MDVVDWDLHAVVRGCTAAAIVTTTNTISRSGGDSGGGGGATSSSSSMADFNSPTRFPNHQSEAKNDTNNNTEDLHQLYKSFFPKSSLSSINFSKDEQQQQQQQFKKQQKPTAISSRSKRRKNQLKKVCQIPAEGVSTDVWAWRKYGQKPIKGSPYPRGYYRCSTSKGCLARKQVDQNKSDPGMFIVTYTGEHNHPAPTYRNSLAGSTRQKTQTDSAAKHADSLSPTTSVDEEEVVVQGAKAENGEVLGGDDDLGMSDTAVSDDFFEGLEGLADAVTGDCFPDHFPASIDLPLGC